MTVQCRLVFEFYCMILRSLLCSASFASSREVMLPFQASLLRGQGPDFPLVTVGVACSPCCQCCLSEHAHPCMLLQSPSVLGG